MVKVEPDASAPVTPHSPPPSRPSAEGSRFERGARYSGVYWCARGSTDLTLTFDEVDADAIEATFAFHHDGVSGGNSVDGSFRMHGTFDKKGNRLVLKGVEWIDQPSGFTMVDLMGNVGRSGVISGSVAGPRCTTFAVKPETH